MLEKNVLTFSRHLEEMNLKNTADAFKREFISKPNDAYELGKYNILKHLQKELNKCTGTNTSVDYSPTSARKKIKPEDPTFTNLLSKISKRQKEKKEESKNNEKSINKNSTLYLHLSSQIQKQYENILKEKIKKNKGLQDGGSLLRMGESQDLDEREDGYGSGEDLPMFGSAIMNTNKKKKDDNILNNNILTSEGDDNNNNSKAVLNNSFGDTNNNIQIDINNDSSMNDNNQNKNKTKEENNFNTLNEEEIKNNYNNEKNTIEEYQDDEDPGYDLYECDIEYFRDTCQKLSEDNDFPHRGVYKSKYRNYKQVKIPFVKPAKKIENAKIKLITYSPGDGYKLNNNPNQDEIWKHSKLSKQLNFPKSKSEDDNYYPVYYNGQFIDSYSLKVVVDRERTGFEESKDFKIVINNLIAGRYQILGYLGNAAFSKAVKCLDTKDNILVCLKIIENNKNYFDQSLDEIKVLNFVNSNGNPDELNFLKAIDFFYYKEHLIIVTELLNDNLYDFYDYLLKNKIDDYFTLSRIQAIAKQVLISLRYIHSLHLIHCDLKPENILLKKISQAEVKVIDFGSSNFIYDSSSSYIQSRSYRAPEVIMGCNYDYKIDIWSLGCILAELYSKTVLFQSDSVHSLLARVIGIIGPIPEWMFEKGTTVKGMFCDEKLLYMEAEAVNDTNANISTNSVGKKKMHVIVPKRTLLKNRLHCEDEHFIEFLRYLLKIDPNERPTADEALNHPWFNVKY